MKDSNRRLTRREYAVGMAESTYPDDLGARDLLARLIEHGLGDRYDSLGNRKDGK